MGLLTPQASVAMQPYLAYRVCLCKNNAEVLILGVFGCGAFRNNLKVVAKVYKDVIGEFEGVFEVIEFAVYCTYDDVNYRVFAEEFNV